MFRTYGIRIRTFVDFGFWIGTNNWLEKFESSISSITHSKSQNLFAGKILETLSASENSIVITRSSGSARTAYPRETMKTNCYWAPLCHSLAISPSHPFLIRHDTHRFTHYRRYYRQCCAYPHAWLETCSRKLVVRVFLLCLLRTAVTSHYLKASLRRGVRGVDALRILQTGTMDREWCRIHERERIAVLERLPTVRQQRPFAPSTEFIVRF